MVTHLPWLPSLLSIGWDAEPLGMPHGDGPNGDRDAVAALQIVVNAGTLARLRYAWDLPDAVLPHLAN
jgi:acyl homoserine lactone synthase/acyl-homoserine lactone synthase